jgi:uncharacterized protein YigE (DUF2233 family)
MPKRFSNYTYYKNNIKCFFLLFCFMQNVYAQSWRETSPGLWYVDLKQDSATPWSHIHAFKVDLNTYDFNLAHTTSLTAVTNLAKEQHAIIAFNGGFFDKNGKPLGLRISNSKQENAYKNISWWGIFSILNSNKAQIAAAYKYQANKDTIFAIQAGPRLIINNKIPHLRQGFAERTALGIDKEGNVIVVVTENLLLDTHSLAEIMQKEPLNCQNALNLDGGSSSQLYVKLDNLSIDHQGLAKVYDAVVINKKSRS